MDNIIEILRQLEITTSHNQKAAILLQHKDNDTFKSLLEYVYSPFKIYGIGKKTFRKAVPSEEFHSIFDLLDYLLENNTGSEVVKDRVNAFLAAQPPENIDWYKRIILKNLRVGIQSSTINGIYPGLIPVFNCQLANPLTNKHPSEILIEPKFDGIRNLSVGNSLFTRSGKLLTGFNEIEKQLEILRKITGGMYVFDGELMGRDFTATQELTFAHLENKTGVNLHIFDCILLDKFKSGRDDTPLSIRKNTLKDIICSAPDIPNIKLVTTMYSGPYNQQTIDTIHRAIVSQGYEGSMIKDLHSPYECKRTRTWLKRKDFIAGEFTVVGMFEGDGRLTGTLGGVIIDYKGYTVRVGSGITDEQRISFWNNPESIIGKVITVQAQGESQDKDSNLSLRFPVFKHIRKDI